MKRTLALLALCALPIAASAQVPVPAVRGPRTTGITVNASDVATTPATSADITLFINGVAQTTKIDSAAVAPIVDALVASGADAASVQLPPGLSAGGYAQSVTLTATVKNPTTAMMRKGVLTVGEAAAKLPTIRVGNAQVILHASDCSAAITKARSAAIALARKKAQEVAKELGVQVGPVISVTAYDGSTTDSSCATQYSVGSSGPQFYGPYGAHQTDDYTTITVTANVTITFSMK